MRPSSCPSLPISLPSGSSSPTRAADWYGWPWAACRCAARRCSVPRLRHPDASYAEIAAALDMPIGSIGPTRMRCLEHLRRQLVDDGAMSETGEW